MSKPVNLSPSPPNILVVGSILADVSIKTPLTFAEGRQNADTLLGQKIPADSFSLGPGGKGANTAVAMARADAEVALVAYIGDDRFGSMGMTALRQAGVNIASIEVDPNATTGIGIILIDPNGENTIWAVNGANSRLTPALVEAAFVRHSHALDAVLVSFEVPEVVVKETVRLAVERHLLVVVDAGPPRIYQPDAWAGCTVFSPNIQEAALLVGYPIDDEAAAERAARDLLETGPQAVLLKRGEAGALLATSEGLVHIPAPHVDVIDTTGAGDAFTATLTVALAEGLSLPAAARRASAAGALAATQFGTLVAMPTRQAIDDLIRTD